MRAHRDGRAGRGRRPRAVSPRFVQGAGGRQVKTSRQRARWCSRVRAVERRVPVPPPLAHQGPGAPPVTITQDALQQRRRTKHNSGFRGRRVARRGSVQAKAGLLPPSARRRNTSATRRGGQRQPQRPLRLDGQRQHVRAWALCAGTFLPASSCVLRCTRPRLRSHGVPGSRSRAGIAVTVTRNYYGWWPPSEVRHGAAGGSAGGAFLENVRGQEQLGRVARNDVLKAVSAETRRDSGGDPGHGQRAPGARRAAVPSARTSRS
jgi:cation diffusion facilitator CzcD-associated flavoprotein CzcO